MSPYQRLQAGFTCATVQVFASFTSKRTVSIVHPPSNGTSRISASPWSGGPVREDPLTQALDPSALEGAVLRTRREGDRIRPLGGGDKLLSDYFIDKKVDRPLRDAVPLVAVGNRVHWVVGHGISREAALKGGGQVLLRFEYKK